MDGWMARKEEQSLSTYCTTTMCYHQLSFLVRSQGQTEGLEWIGEGKKNDTSSTNAKRHNTAATTWYRFVAKRHDAPVRKEGILLYFISSKVIYLWFRIISHRMMIWWYLYIWTNFHFCSGAESKSQSLLIHSSSSIHCTVRTWVDNNNNNITTAHFVTVKEEPIALVLRIGSMYRQTHCCMLLFNLGRSHVLCKIERSINEFIHSHINLTPF